MHFMVESSACRALPEALSHGVHHLRFRVFRERLNWDIPSVNQLERDDYDDQNPIVVLARARSSVIGCCRLLPTTGRYMLKDTFPVLLGASKAPEVDDVWEISRFAVVKESRAGLGFTEIPSALIREVVRFAQANGIRSYVFVTTVAFERLLRRMGVTIERFASPQQIGIERSVALWMHIDDATVSAVDAASTGREQPVDLAEAA